MLRSSLARLAIVFGTMGIVNADFDIPNYHIKEDAGFLKKISQNMLSRVKRSERIYQSSQPSSRFSLSFDHITDTSVGITIHVRSGDLFKVEYMNNAFSNARRIIINLNENHQVNVTGLQASTEYIFILSYQQNGEWHEIKEGVQTMGVHREVAWKEWSNCSDGFRSRMQCIVTDPEVAGRPCPISEIESEACVDCVMGWGRWSTCYDGRKMRDQKITVQPVGAGEPCPLYLEHEEEACVDCVVAWKEWSNCSDGFRSRMQYIVTDPEGPESLCPILEIESEVCVDCALEWGRWSTCYDGRKMRYQRITAQPVGAGEPCPPYLKHEEEECRGADMNDTTVICRFVKKVLGYGGRARMRDLLLMGDESGSIGWYNYEKIKDNFKAIVEMVNGGIGTQKTQLAMTSFALYTRVIFDFDDHHDADSLKQAIDETFYKGGYRSRIGEALTDTNEWVFQQSGGMRSFPRQDNIEHEILIATDGCRTSDVYHLKKGLRTIKDRGIKLYVIAVDIDNTLCLATVKYMIEDEDDLFLIGGWDDLDQFNIKILERECFPPGAEEEEEAEEDKKPEPILGRGDSTRK